MRYTGESVPTHRLHNIKGNSYRGHKNEGGTGQCFVKVPIGLTGIYQLG